MKQNMGTVDRGLRAVVAVTIFVLWLAGVISGTFALVLCAVAFVFLVTALIGWCPLYTPFGISTRGRESRAAI